MTDVDATGGLEEENLKRLLGVALAAAPPREELQLRLAAALRAEASLVASARPRQALPRRALLMAVPAAATAVAAVLLAAQTPAQALQMTLAAMAAVRTAHATGTFINYTDRHPRTHEPLPGAMKVEYWYRAPDRYRRDLGPKVHGWSVIPGELIVNGKKGVFVGRYQPDAPTIQPVEPARFMDELSSFDYFSQEGFVARAAREKAVRIHRRTGELEGKQVSILTIDWQRQRVPPHLIRSRWILSVDPQSARILRAEFLEEWQKNGEWTPAFREVLDRFDYDRELPQELFVLPRRLASE